MATLTFEIGNTVARKLAPTKTLRIVRIEDGMFVLSDAYGSPKGGAWASDLLHMAEVA